MSTAKASAPGATIAPAPPAFSKRSDEAAAAAAPDAAAFPAATSATPTAAATAPTIAGYRTAHDAARAATSAPAKPNSTQYARWSCNIRLPAVSGDQPELL